MVNFPIYISCHFFPGKSTRCVYQITKSTVEQHPYQLFKSSDVDSTEWENLSVYASIEDAVMIVLKDLVGVELAGEIIHGQATINPSHIITKIDRGEHIVSIFGSVPNDSFRQDLDVNFEDLVERK